MPLSEAKLKELQEIARQIRIDIVRMTHAAGCGHPGGSLSAVDILTVLYFHKMNHNPKKPNWENRDRFVLSKGHACPALYSALAEVGYFPKEELRTFRKLGSRLQGHPSTVYGVPGVEASTGSLGQGLGMAVGMALAYRLDKRNARIYAMIGDGESQEGSIWEAAMSAAHYGLDNLTAFLDRNMLQIDGCTEDVMSLEPLEHKWKGFGWNVIVIDGHDMNQIVDAIEDAENVKGMPTMIIANTVKGKGVSFMENELKFHGVAPNDEEYEQAMKEFGKR
jgi:transketolase